MSDRDVEAMLGELKPAGLSQNADAAILDAIRSTRIEQSTIGTDPYKLTPVYARPVPAWVAAAACFAVGAATWMFRAQRRIPTVEPLSPVTAVESDSVRPVAHRIHVESDIFVATPRRSLDVSNWSPHAGATPENRS